jgi:ribosomal protein S18 acetylase RimI-like enzyme
MCAARFLPIDLARHFDLCLQFLSDAFVCSYGNADELERMGGPDAYRNGLRDSLATFPAGAVHVWNANAIVGQVEMRLRADLGVGVVNLFYLLPHERGRGLGSALQTYAVDVFRRHGFSKARLSVAPTNTRAMRYYAKHGWRDLGPRPDRLYVHAMELDLPTIPARVTDAG